MIKKSLKEYFSFSRREQNGILVLFSIVLVLVLVNIGLSWLPARKISNDAEIKEVLEDFDQINTLTSNPDTDPDAVYGEKSYESNSELFYFDPNKASKEEWLKLGLHGKVLNTLLRYIEKGGKFYENEDLMKIYGMDSAFYSKVEPFIRFKSLDKSVLEDHLNSGESPSSSIIELNRADTTDLLPLQGIGPVLARRILKYRNILGGFVVKEQLVEVYGISADIFKKISTVIEVDSTLVKKLDLNQSDYSSFIRHPYFSKELTIAILNYRKEVGSFKSVSEIISEGIATNEEFIKILPYVSVGR